MGRRQHFANHHGGRRATVTISKIGVMQPCFVLWGTEWGEEVMAVNGEAVLENVRRYRTIASLYRQTAAFRPHQRGTLLEQAQQWEERAVAELESYFVARTMASEAQATPKPYYARGRWELTAAA